MSSTVSSILGQDATLNQAATSKTAQDKDMFLKLLVAQLSHQDPLNPVEDKEFVAQLAQFTSVEELQKVNTNLESQMKMAETNQLSNAVSFVGRRVLANGDTVSKVGDEYMTPMFFSNDEALENCTINVMPKGSTTILFSKSFGAYLPGEHPVTGNDANVAYMWDGKDFTGKPVADGLYEVSISGTNKDGKAVLIKSEVMGDVMGVEIIDGVSHLRMADYSTVKFTDVSLVGSGSSSGGSGGKKDDETAGGAEG